MFPVLYSPNKPEHFLDFFTSRICICPSRSRRHIFMRIRIRNTGKKYSGVGKKQTGFATLPNFKAYILQELEPESEPVKKYPEPEPVKKYPEPVKNGLAPQHWLQPVLRICIKRWDGSGSISVSNNTDPDPTKTIENRKYVPTQNRDLSFY